MAIVACLKDPNEDVVQAAVKSLLGFYFIFYLLACHEVLAQAAFQCLKIMYIYNSRCSSCRSTLFRCSWPLWRNYRQISVK